MFEIGQRVFQTQLKTHGIVEAADAGRVTIRFDKPDGRQSPHRSVYGPKWFEQNPNSILVAPMKLPPFHARELEELED